MPRIKICKEDKMFSQYIRWERDGGNCQRCGKHYDQPSQALHCSHFYGRAKKATRFDPNNCVALCYGCHQYFEQRKNAEYADWMKERIGEGEFEALTRRANSYIKYDKAKEAFWVWYKSRND
jgi:5-methylcytosine-specific restriction endonuclease McrA